MGEQVWVIQNSRIVALDQEAGSHGRPVCLDSSRCYILLYDYCPGVDLRQTRVVIYCWHGKLSSRSDRASSTMCMNEVSTLAGLGRQEDREVVLEGRESKHFVIAAGRLLITCSSSDKATQVARGAKGAGQEGHRMFAVIDMGCGSASSSTVVAESGVSRGRAGGGGGGGEGGKAAGKAVEVPPEHRGLYSGRCFVLLRAAALSPNVANGSNGSLKGALNGGNSGQKVGFVWRGCAVRDGALELALRAVQRLLAVDAASVGNLVHVVQEGVSSPAMTQFHAVLGGRETGYATLPPPSADSLSKHACHLGLTRVLHLEAAGQLLRPREMLYAGAEDLLDSANGLCLVDRIDPMHAGNGSVYVWHTSSCPPQRYVWREGGRGGGGGEEVVNEATLVLLLLWFKSGHA
jgi:hypothetical protein